MSDSDWEVLSTDGHAPATSPRTISATANASFDGSSSPNNNNGNDGDANESPHAYASHAIDRRTVLKPLCLTLNQTGTRLGVGHTKGYLVFRVSTSKADAPSAEVHAAATQPPFSSTETHLRPQSQLILDAQYNVDLLTFSHVRERMQQQRLQRASQQAAAAAATTKEGVESNVLKASTGLAHADGITSAAPHREDVHVPTRSHSDAGDERLCETSSDQKHDAESGSLGSPLLDLDNIGSFLTAAGRAFAQIKRDDALSDVQAAPSSRREELHDHASHDKRHTVPTPTVKPQEHPEKSDEPDIACREPETNHSAEQPTQAQLPPSPVLEWGEDEDIDVDVSDSSTHDVQLGSIGDSIFVHRRTRCTTPAAAAADRTHPLRSADPNREEESEESEESYVGFEGGGVAVMSFLYDQTWLALVGGGETPMGPPNQIQFVRDGELQHQLLVPHPVVRLFLDARLLFIVTTAELRVYTNPLEHNWVCLRQRIAMSTTLAARYSAVSLAFVPSHEYTAAAESQPAPSHVQNSSLASPASVNAGALPDDKQPSREASADVTTTAKPAPSIAATDMCVALPSMPVVVDYARSLLLLPVGDACNGFALYHYITGPEPIERPATSDAGGSEGDVQRTHSSAPLSSTTTGRTTAYLQRIALQQEAHKNPLHSLVLYVGWPAATTRLLATTRKGAAHAKPSNNFTTTSSASVSQTGAAAAALSAYDHSNSRLGGGGTVTLVAASSEYATRITLWMLKHEEEDEEDNHHIQQQQQQQQQQKGKLGTSPQDSHAHHHDPQRSTLARGSSISAATLDVFVLLREFRVGLRPAAPKVVMAALPSVSRFVSRAQPTTATSPPPRLPGGGSSSASNSNAASQYPSTASLVYSHQKAGESEKRRNNNSSTSSSSNAAGLYALPHDTASTSTYRGTMAAWAKETASTVAAWATEAASTVAACTSTSAAVHHLQFIGNGAYLLCVHGNDVISVFSTSAPESPQEAKDVTRDRAAAEQNRYSRLSIMKEYLPRALSNRLDAYTRQAWSSCTGHLPTSDAAFVPRWLYLKRQDAVAAAAARSQSNVRCLADDTASTTTNASPASAGNQAKAASPGSAIPHGNPSGRRFFRRLTALVGSRSQPARLPASTPTSAAVTASTQPASSRSVVSVQDSPRASLADLPSVTEQALTPHSSSTDFHHPSNASVCVYWGAPLSGVPQCVQIWPASLHSSLDGDSSGSRGGRVFFGAVRQPIVLNCATCEGAFVNVFLFEEEGEIATSSVVPYAAE
ncbi:hypothetical protein N2W54_004251 [Lotmaria passim]